MSPYISLAFAQSPGWSAWWIVAGIAGVIVLVILLVIAQFFRLWLQAYMSNADVRMTDLIGMRLRKVDMSTIVFAKIQLVKSGIHDMTVNDLESHYLAGGRVGNVTRAMIAANRAALNLDWKKACAIDLAGRDITDAVNTSVNPKVIDCPDMDASSHGTDRLDAVAKDGIRLLAKACVTVRTNIRQLIGGATEKTIIARGGRRRGLGGGGFHPDTFSALRLSPFPFLRTRRPYACAESIIEYLAEDIRHVHDGRSVRVARGHRNIPLGAVEAPYRIDSVPGFATGAAWRDADLRRDKRHDQ